MGIQRQAGRAWDPEIPCSRIGVGPVKKASRLLACCFELLLRQPRCILVFCTRLSLCTLNAFKELLPTMRLPFLRIWIFFCWVFMHVQSVQSWSWGFCKWMKEYCWRGVCCGGIYSAIHFCTLYLWSIGLIWSWERYAAKTMRTFLACNFSFFADVTLIPSRPMKIFIPCVHKWKMSSHFFD